MSTISFGRGPRSFSQDVIAQMCRVFCVGNSENGTLKYVGLNIESGERSFLVHQIAYASTLRTVVMSHRRMQNKDALLTEDEKRKFRSIVDQLSWISTQPRPDVAFDVFEFSQLYSRANVGDLVRVNKTVQRVKTDLIKLMYPQLKNLKGCFLECYADASFGNLADGGSRVGGGGGGGVVKHHISC